MGLYALLRNEGGSVGTSMAKTLLDRREQFHVERVGEWLDPLNPNLNAGLDELRPTFLGLTGDPARADSMAWQSISDLRDQQALSLSYFDCFWPVSSNGTENWNKDRVTIHGVRFWSEEGCAAIPEA